MRITVLALVTVIGITILTLIFDHKVSEAIIKEHQIKNEFLTRRDSLNLTLTIIANEVASLKGCRLCPHCKTIAGAREISQDSLRLIAVRIETEINYLTGKLTKK